MDLRGPVVLLEMALLMAMLILILMMGMGHVDRARRERMVHQPLEGSA